MSFRFPWLRNLVRKYTKPIQEDDAHLWKRRISFVYFFIGWNTLALIFYSIYKNKVGKDGVSADQLAKSLGRNNVQVYRISGFNVKKIQEAENKETADESIES